MRLYADVQNRAAANTAVDAQLFWGAVALSFLLAVAKRYPFLPSPDFPIGEGGLFVAFSQAILDHGYHLPTAVRYGGISIPFAYPPAAFYLAAFVSDLTGADLFKVYRHLPLALNLLAVPGFCYLAKQYTKDRLVFVCAPLLYALMPESFIWQIQGGGMPRALAAVSALLGVGLALRAARKGPSIPVAMGCGLLVGLAMLSHLEWGMLAAVGVTLAMLTRRPGLRGFSFLVGAGVISLLVIAPWLALVMSTHGLAPFRSASTASEWWPGNFAKMVATGQIFIGTPALLALLGAVISIAARDFFAAIWAPVILLVTPRMGLSSGLAIPTALLGAYGLRAAGDFIERTVREMSLVRRRWYPSRVLTTTRPGLADYAAIVLLIALSVVQLTTKLPMLLMEHKVLGQVTPPQRDAMRWIARETEPGDKFVIVSDAKFWWSDRIAEWFPYLTQRTSVTTAQGQEWVGPGAFMRRLKEIENFKSVQEGGPVVLPDFIRRTYCDVGYVAVFLPPTAPEYVSLKSSELYTEVYDNGQAMVFRSNATADVACPAR